MSIFRKKESMQKQAAKQGMALYFVKYLGAVPVTELKGDAAVADALARVSVVIITQWNGHG